MVCSEKCLSVLITRLTRYIVTIGIILGIALILAQPAQARAPQAARPLTPPEIAEQQAKKHGLDPQLFKDVIKCESGWDIAAEGDHVDGKPTSFGLAQFHYPERDWGITVEQANDPSIAIPLMAETWAKGEKWRRKWSCYSQLVTR